MKVRWDSKVRFGKRKTGTVVKFRVEREVPYTSHTKSAIGQLLSWKTNWPTQKFLLRTLKTDKSSGRLNGSSVKHQIEIISPTHIFVYSFIYSII